MNSSSPLQSLINDGVIDEVLQLVKDGQHASIYTVRCAREIRCAKVYRNGDQQASSVGVQAQQVQKGNAADTVGSVEVSAYSAEEQLETNCGISEALALTRLAKAGVRVPQVFWHSDDVLLMEFIAGANGHAAPGVDEVDMLPDEAVSVHRLLMSHLARMLNVGLLHGDWSAQNVLVGTDGPVIIDCARLINTRGNLHAEKILHWNVTTISVTLARSEPTLMASRFADEIWALYQQGRLLLDTILTGDFIEPNQPG